MNMARKRVTPALEAEVIQTLVDASKSDTPALDTLNNTELVTLAVPVPKGPKANCVCANCKQMQAVKPGQVTRQ